MVTKVKLELYFVSGDLPELVKTHFSAPGQATPILGLRGNSVPPHMTPFRWAPAMHALALFFVKVRENFHLGQIERPIFQGLEASPANTIVNLLYKRPTCWVLDLFGVDCSGRPLLRRPIVCCNYLKRRPGPIEIFFRSGFMTAEDITIFLEDRDISEEQTRITELRKPLEVSWKPAA